MKNFMRKHIIIGLPVVSLICFSAGCATDKDPPDAGLTPAAANALYPRHYLDTLTPLDRDREERLLLGK